MKDLMSEIKPDSGKNAMTAAVGSRVESADFEAAYGEPLSCTLDLSTWTQGVDVAALLDQAEQMVSEALEREAEYLPRIRDILFRELPTAPDAPLNAGVYRARRADLEKVHTGLLFNGGVEACDGTSVVHDTLPLTITQIGVCLVSYNGEQGSWAHRLYRRDLRAKLADPVEEVLAVLEQREKRGSQGQEEDSLSELARRGIMAYAERAILREKSNASWRMGARQPCSL